MILEKGLPSWAMTTDETPAIRRPPPTLTETLDELEELLTETFDQLDGYLPEDEQGASSMVFARCSMLIRRVRNTVSPTATARG